MPDALEAPAPQTTLQAEISAKTAAAVQDTGFGKDFDVEVEAAIAKDSGQPPPKTAAAEPQVPKKEAPKSDKPAAPGLDIPEALLGKKEKPAVDAKGAESTDAEREKFIKEQTAGLSPKAADRFRSIEAKAHAAEQKAQRLENMEKELIATRERLAASADRTEADALKKQVEELDGIVQKNALAEHPKFKAHFDTQIAKEVGIAAKLVPKEAAAEVEALLSLPETAQRNRRLNEIASELDPIEANKFHGAVDRADRLASDKAGELANWKVNKTKLAELTETEQRQSVEHRKATVETALKTVLPKFTNDENGVELFRKVEGNEEWNKSVEARLGNVRKLTEANLRPEDVAEMAAWAISGEDYRKMFLTQRALIQRYQEEIAAMKSGEPGLGDGPGAADSGEDEKGSMIDIVSRVAQKSGAVR